MQTIPLSNVKITNRMRKELGDLTGLKDSIRRHGVIQPIVLDPNHNLIAGERRYRSCEQLGLESVPFIYSTEVDEATKAELEFEENYWRKSMTWVEESLGVLDIFEKRKTQGALKGFSENWTLTTGEMFGMQGGTISYVLNVARELRRELTLPEDKRRYHKFQSANEAYRLGILADKADELNKELAKRARASVNQTQTTQPHAIAQQKLVEDVKKIQASPVELQNERERYASNPLNVQPFEEYWKEKQALAEDIANTVYLSGNVLHVNCIDFMCDDDNIGRFDHIITDPPYAIDMANLDQAQGGMVDIDRVADAHHVDENLELLKNFFPAAWKCTKPNAFVITCCDPMIFVYMHELATAAGFAVQRWPYIWRKVNQSVGNQSAGYNTTKDYEIVMIARKPSTTLYAKRNTSFTDASNNEVTKLTGHPFAKPFELTKDLVEMVSMPGQTILEPFAGGGSMVLEMLRLKRNVIALEKKEHHYNQLLENLKNHYYLKLNKNFKFK